MTTCMACLEDADDADYHARCLRRLFGSATLPTLAIDASRLHVSGLEMAGHVVMSGVQRKIALRLADAGRRLEVAPEGSRYILKPPPETFPLVPENEHLSLLLAETAGIEIPPLALLRLSTGQRALIVKRFDRADDGHKLRQEDFCQLSFRSTKDRYQGSAEQVVKVVKRFASEPVVELVKLFRMLLFSWCIGNGDLHLKNLSLLCGEDRLHRISPAYDLLSTELVLGDDTLALPVGGKKKNLTRRVWLEFAKTAGLSERATSSVLEEVISSLSRGEKLVAGSFLSQELKDAYLAGLRKKVSVLRRAR
ncbi:MAG: type II toxin-antitoxin system HipA family toxin [Myxococcaceae bacterium]